MNHQRRCEDARFAVFFIFLGACFLMGGASRLDVSSLVVLQPLAVISMAALLLIPGSNDWRIVRYPLIFLCGLAALHAAQLVPLPPSIWAKLPGHTPIASGISKLGLPQTPRPLSLAPDLTLASLVGLVMPLAAVVGFAGIAPRHRAMLVFVLAGGAVLSALVALLQVVGGQHSILYLYRVTNVGAAVGLFANRNHQALLLAAAWPMLAVAPTLMQFDRKRQLALRATAAGMAVFFLPMLLVTGSRAGLALGVAGIVCAGALWAGTRARSESSGASTDKWIMIGLGVIGAAIIAATILLSRAEAIQRLLSLGAETDTRVEVTPILLQMVRDFFPVGVGFGSFDPVYRIYEPLQLLDIRYLNHAHNDLLELVITAGIGGIIILLGFLGWIGSLSLRAWLRRDSSSDAVLARLGSIIIALTLASSLVDYPLRTPLMMVIFAIACGWLASFRPRATRLELGRAG